MPTTRRGTLTVNRPGVARDRTHPHDPRDRIAHPAPLAVPARRSHRRVRRGGQAHRRDQGRHRERVVFPGPLPGPAGDAGRHPGRGAGPDDGRLRRQAAGLRRPDRAVRGRRRLPLQARREPRRHAPPRRSRWRSSAAASDAAAAWPASTAKPPARRRSASSSPAKASFDDAGHRAVRRAWQLPSRSRRSAAAIRTERPDLVAVAGDLVLNGPDPAGTVDLLREMEADGAAIVSGNTDIAVADFDYAAAFPWMTDGVPDTFRAAAEWAHDELGDERIGWLRRLPAERRLRAEDGTMILVCHASPGSQTAGFDQALDPNVIIERVARTDARVIACGHTHLPEVRDLGWKLIVEQRLGGLHLRRRADRVVGAHRPRGRRDPGRDPAAPNSTRSRSPTRSPPAASRATSIGPRRCEPGSWSDDRGDRATAGRGDRDGPGDRAGQRRRDHLGGAGRGPLGRAHDRGLRSRAADLPDRRRGRRLRRRRPARSEGAPAHRPVHPVRPRRGSRGARPGRPAGALRGRPGRADRGRSSGPVSAGSARSSTASRRTRCAARTGSARSSSRWASPTSGPARSPSSSA